MRESLLKAEAKYLDQDGESSKNRESSEHRKSSKDSDSDWFKDSDSSDEDVYSNKPKTNSSKIRCEECKEELIQKNYAKHIQSLKHK